MDPCLEIIGASDFNELVQTVYKPDFTRDRIAALFPAVLQEAEKGDEVSRQLLQNSGEQLAATARAILVKLGLTRLALFGGVLENAPPVRKAFVEELRKSVPNLEIIAPRYDAAVGAALLLN
jgi:N-acetylglucosamine kinase-like BadF-type ATPase